MSPKVIIFDFDGTIADTLNIIIQAALSFADELNLKKIKKCNLSKLRHKTSKAVIKELCIPLAKLPSFVKKFRKAINRNLEFIKPFRGIKPLLSVLKRCDYQLGILTSNDPSNVKKFLKRHQLDFFDFIYSETSLFGKSRVINNLLKKQSLKSQEVIYVGDETRDIEAARKSKIKMIAVTWGFNSKQILRKMKPDFLIDKPKELLKILTS